MLVGSYLDDLIKYDFTVVLSPVISHLWVNRRGGRTVKLALRNLIHDQMRFAVTIVGIAFAVFLMVFQGSLLAGVIRTASRPIEASDAQLWITARGVQCFEYATPMPNRFYELAYFSSRVASVQRIIGAFAQWKGASGAAHLVFLVGAEAGVGGSFPMPYANEKHETVLPNSILVDATSAGPLEAGFVPVDLEVNNRRARVTGHVRDFATFLGTPYAFTNYWDAVSYLGIRPEQTGMLAVHLRPGSDVLSAKRILTLRLPDADVWTREEFATRSQRFWVIKTGAGAALLTAALLGLIVGLVVVSENIYATTIENIEEYATLKAIGASPGYIHRAVLLQAIACGLIGSLCGIVIVYCASLSVRNFIPWIYTPWWLPLTTSGIELVMCCLASVVSIRKALLVEPARVFRA